MGSGHIEVILFTTYSILQIYSKSCKLKSYDAAFLAKCMISIPGAQKLEPDFTVAEL